MTPSPEHPDWQREFHLRQRRTSFEAILETIGEPELAREAAEGRFDTPRIVTSFVCPPIPYRGNDWCAYRDGQEEAGGYGYGETEAEAIQDLLEIEGRFDPEPRKEGQ